MPLIGTVVSHYRVIEKLGGGGMGIVYEAEDLRLGRRVALKFLPAEMSKHPHAVERFRREARAASALNHPSICTVHDIGEHEGQHYIVMERLEGETLKHHVGTARLDIDKVMDVGMQLADALDAAHGKGIVHRDIKPANIFYTRRGQAKMLDFGLAKLMAAGTGAQADEAEPTASWDEPLSRPGMALGTMAYMSPEQARGEDIDARTDLFSFGVVLYELVTGRQAFSGRTSAVIFDAILNAAPVAPVRLNPTCPPELDHIINKALEKNRSLRYQSASEMLADLRRARRDSGSAVTPAASGARTSAVRRLAVDRRAWAGAAVVIALVAGAVLLLNSRRAPALTERDSIVLADFVNTTGEPVFDGTLRRALAVQMEQSPYLHVVDDEQTRRVLRLMGRSPDESLTHAVAREVCERGGVKAMLAGSIASLGRNYVIDLQATNCRTGNSLAREQREAESRENVIQTLGHAASALRGKLGESMASIQKFDTPADDATTSSLEALKAYSLAEDMRARTSGLDSIPFYKKAIELDPNFAVALARLGVVYSNSAEQELAKEYSKKAFALRDRVSEHERLYIDTHYYRHVTGELDKEIETLELYRRTYPRDFTPSNSLAVLYIMLGQPEKALASAQDAAQLEPNHVLPHGTLAFAYRRLGRWDEAKAICQSAAAQKVDSASCHRELYRVAVIQGDEAEMQRQVDWAHGNAEEHSMRRLEASVAALRGRFTAARELAREGIDMAMRQKLKQSAAVSLALLGLYEAYVGNASLAKKIIAEALAIDRSGERLIVAAHVLGISGDAVQASALVEEANRKMPSTHTLFHAIDLPVAQAAIHLARGAPAKSLDALKPGAPYERGRFGVYGGLYLRALAHLEAGHGPQAASDFESILHDKGAGGGGPVVAIPIWPALARLGLARAAALSGDVAKSRRAYQDFLALWKDADPDVPILIQAKAEYAKLGS